MFIWKFKAIALDDPERKKPGEIADKVTSKEIWFDVSDDLTKKTIRRINNPAKISKNIESFLII